MSYSNSFHPLKAAGNASKEICQTNIREAKVELKEISKHLASLDRKTMGFTKAEDFVEFLKGDIAEMQRYLDNLSNHNVALSNALNNDERGLKEDGLIGFYFGKFKRQETRFYNDLWSAENAIETMEKTTKAVLQPLLWFRLTALATLSIAFD